MNYKRIYLELVKKRVKHPAKLQFQYTENHHIKPVSIFPEQKDNKNNLVNLSARQHFIAHALLVKHYKQKGDKNNYCKMLAAFTAMSTLWGSNRSSQLRYKCGNRKSYLYATWKEQLSRYIKQTGCRAGVNATNYGKKIIHNDILHQQKYIYKEQSIPDGWQLGPGSWTVRSGKDSFTYNKVWCYNVKTNEQFYVDKSEFQVLLAENKDIKHGISPLSKVHEQQYNPLNYNIWISNLTLKQFKLWPKDKEIPRGWLRGKVSNFEQYLQRYKLAKQNKLAYFINYEQDIKNKRLPKIRLRNIKNNNKIPVEQLILIEQQKQLQKKQNINNLQEYYKVYCQSGFKGVVQKFNYSHTKQALVQAFAKHVPEFIPQNGKKRGK